MKMRILRMAAAVLLIQTFALPVSLLAQDAKRAEVYQAIRKEANDNSKIMHSLHMLTDLYGPRLTGSPNHVNAAKWAAREMLSWGFDKADIEPWEFGHPGWVNERNYGLMLTPVADTLTFEVLAWTPSTKGPAIGDAVSFIIPTFPATENPQVQQMPTQAELTAYFDSMKAQVSGKMVLVGKPTFVDQSKDPAPKHLTDEELKRRMDPNPAPAASPTPARPNITPRANALTPLQVSEQLDKFFLDNNVLVRINESQLDRGAVRAFNNRTFDVTKVVPTVVMRNEDFGRIYRLLADKTPVRLEFDLRSRIVPDGVTSYSVGLGEGCGRAGMSALVNLGSSSSRVARV